MSFVFFVFFVFFVLNKIPNDPPAVVVSFRMHTAAVVGLILTLTCGLVVAAPPAAKPSTQPAAKVTRDVVFATPAGVKLKLDVSVPATPGPHPAVILVHGGAWQAGDKTNFRALFQPLTDAGYAWFSINYRLAPKFTIPACVEDVETAVTWVKAHAAEYDIDPDRVALLGESAGGHLVELVAARSAEHSPVRPAAVVAFYAPSDLPALAVSSEAHGIAVGSMFSKLFGHAELDETATKLMRDASPLTYVKAGLPPFLLLHGTADTLVPIAQSTAFQAACRAVGVPCDLVTVQGGTHGMILWNLIDQSYKAKVLKFLDQTMKTPAGAKKA